MFVSSHPLFGRLPLSSGSGFIMTQAGLIVTNAHVVASSATVTGRQHLRVQLHDGHSYDASIRDIDKKSDIATIKINPKVGIISQASMTHNCQFTDLFLLPCFPITHFSNNHILSFES